MNPEGTNGGGGTWGVGGVGVGLGGLLSSFDFLELSHHPDVKEASVEALDKYGCGSCGPRGFYGTIDQHLKIEKEIASFMGTQEAIAYSDSASTVSSTIPAFCKKGDLIIVDECHRSIYGLWRGVIEYFDAHVVGLTATPTKQTLGFFQVI